MCLSFHKNSNSYVVYIFITLCLSCNPVVIAGETLRNEKQDFKIKISLFKINVTRDMIKFSLFPDNTVYD